MCRRYSKLTKDVPKVSTLANLRGNMGKSTARMAIHVMIIMVARYTDKKFMYLLAASCLLSLASVGCGLVVRYNAVQAVSKAMFTDCT
jgi:hypothetical protein